MDKLAEAYEWDSDIVLPDPVRTHITQLLALARSCHQSGIEMRQVFIGVEPNGHGIMMDCSDVPKEVIPSWVMMSLEKHHCVAAVSCSEGWTVPAKIAEDWAKNGRPPGNISDHPQAIEILMIQAETQLGTWIATSPIVGKGKERTLEQPLYMQKSDKTRGRLNNLLKCNWTNDRAGTLHKAAEALTHLQANKANKE